MGDPATGDPFKGDRAFKGEGQRLLNGDHVASRHSATRSGSGEPAPPDSPLPEFARINSGSGESGGAGAGCCCCLARRHSRFARARRSTSSCDVTRAWGVRGEAGLWRIGGWGVGVVRWGCDVRYWV